METGIIRGMEHSTYLAEPALSSSMAKIIAYQTPAHLKVYLDEPKETTDAMRFGTAFHMLMESEDAFFQNYMSMPKVDRRTREGKAAYEKATDEAKDSNKLLLDEEQFTSLRAMHANVKNSDVINGLLRDGITEPSGFWQDEESGVWCKFRPDFLSEDWIIDFKTARSIEKWHKVCADYKYDFQAAWYCHGVKLLTGKPRPFIHIACETKPPYGVIVRTFSDAWMEMVEPKIHEAIQKYKICSEANYYPGPSDAIEVMEPPFWRMGNEET